ICGNSVDAGSGNRALPVRYRVVSVVAARSWATFCGSVDGVRRASRSSPIGVSAKVRTASTMRSNSRARRAPDCILKRFRRLTAVRRDGNSLLYVTVGSDGKGQEGPQGREGQDGQEGQERREGQNGRVGEASAYPALR